MAWKKQFRCKQCGYEADVYEGRGFMGQHISTMTCPDCHSLQCGSDRIRIWDGHTCPCCGGRMEETGQRDFWT